MPDSPVVYAERAGYDKLWHPTCFVCAQCGEALVDLVYFWTDGIVLCGRHYCERKRPRCAGCDEVGATGRARSWYQWPVCVFQKQSAKIKMS